MSKPPPICGSIGKHTFNNQEGKTIFPCLCGALLLKWHWRKEKLLILEGKQNEGGC